MSYTAAAAALLQPCCAWRLLQAYLTFAVLHFTWKLWVFAWRRRRATAALSSVPGPELHMDGREFAENMHRFHDWRFDGMVGAVNHSGATDAPLYKFVGPQVEVFALSGDAVRHFLKTRFDRYTKPSRHEDFVMKLFTEWMGGGIFTLRHGSADPAANRRWAHQRNTASHIFTRSELSELMRDTFVEKAHVLNRVVGAAADRGEAVDMQAKFFAFTMDSIMRVFFSRDTDTITHGGDADAYARHFDDAHRSMMEYFRAGMGVAFLSAFLPWPLGGLRVDETGLVVSVHQRINSHARAFGRSVRELTRESLRIISQSRRDPALPTRRDLLALFMQSEGPSGRRYSDMDLRDIVLNFVIAGRDTTACTLTWALYMLATNPEVQAALCEEVDAAFPEADEDPTYDSVSASAMPYLNGLVYEALRLYPPVPEDGKMATADDVLPDGTRIMKGVKMNFCPYTVGRDPARWPEPLEVRPERWIPFKQPDWFDFPVFQAGPRICLGMNMALFEAKLLLVMLLRRFTFTLKEGEAEKITYSITITMALCNSKTADSHNLWLIPKRRDRPSMP